MKNALAVISLVLFGFAAGYTLGMRENAAPAALSFDANAQSGASLRAVAQKPAPKVQQGAAIRPAVMVARLRGKKGEPLERQYLEDMIMYRTGELEMAKLVNGGSVWPEMKTFTSNVIISHARDIKLMQEWLDLWHKGW
jgi:uncharacterized protein (DUF305 family)